MVGSLMKTKDTHAFVLAHAHRSTSMPICICAVCVQSFMVGLPDLPGSTGVLLLFTLEYLTVLFLASATEEYLL